MSRYRWVDSQKADGFAVAAACRVAEVSTSAYYAWREKEALGPSERAVEEACVLKEMQAIHEELDATYGSPRMTSELRRRGFCLNHKRVERIMRANGIRGVTPRRSVRTTLRKAELNPPLPDLVQGDFGVGEPNRRYCGDIQCRRRHWKSYADTWTMPTFLSMGCGGAAFGAGWSA